MWLRGVLQSLQSAAERILLGRPRETMSKAPGKTRPVAALPSAGALPDTARGSSRIPFKLGLVVVVASLCSGFATYLILTGLTPIVPTHGVVVGVLLINAMLVLAMIFIIAWQVTGLWRARQRQVAGAQLHVRIVSLFSVIAVVPAIAARALCQHLAQSRPRSLVLRSHQIDHPELDRRGDGLSARARPGDPRRHRRHGQGHRRSGRAGEVAAARLRQFPHRAGLDAGAAHRLSHRRRRQDARHRGSGARLPLQGRRPKKPWISPRRAR